MLLDLHTCSSQLIFLPLSICKMCSAPKSSLILLFDLISYLSVWSYFSDLKMRRGNFLSRTACFLSFSFDVDHVSHVYKIIGLIKIFYNCIFEFCNNILALKGFCIAKKHVFPAFILGLISLWQWFWLFMSTPRYLKLSTFSKQ